VKQEEVDLERAHDHSSRHRTEILSSDLCGCFYCRRIFPPSAITEWTDEGDEPQLRQVTALCPRCGIDSVIGSESAYPITPDFLSRMKRYWF
jgi:hypothetical protein